MFERVLGSDDPFEGVGARRRAVRARVEALVAFPLAIVACGLTVAMWIRTMAPIAGQLGLG